MDMGLTRQLNDAVLDGLMPDVTYLLTCRRRWGWALHGTRFYDGSRSKSETRFENETLHFHEQVRSGYLALCPGVPRPVCGVDASADPLK
ncbi:MAG: hypothetical protein R2874_01650 [Desulfobacterales bacterium]